MKKSVTFSIFGLLAVAVISAYFLLQESTTTVTGHAILAQYSKDELIQQSDAIVTAEVTKMESFTAPSEINEESIVTNVTLRVSEYLRNQDSQSPEVIVVQTLGGKIGANSVYIDGVATFKEGERVLVFLEKKSDDTYTVYGWLKGKYTLNQDKIGIGEQEISRFIEIFGEELSITQLKQKIELYDDIQPKEEVNEHPSSKNDEEESKDAANMEANSVIN